MTAAMKFEQFEWLMHGITAKSPRFNDEPHGTGEKGLDYQDRLGAIAKMKTQLQKSITSVIIYGDKCKEDYEFIQNHLAKIMADGAYEDGRKEPKGIATYWLAWKIAHMVIQFSLNPEIEDSFTAKGRLYMVAGIKTHEMDTESYRKTWKQYEKTMALCLELQIKCASEVIEKYKEETQKEFMV